MYFLIHEDEFNRIETVMMQLGLMVAMGSNASPNTTVRAELVTYSLDAFHQALNAALTAIGERASTHAGRVNNAPDFTSGDFVHALRIAKGERQRVPAGTKERVGNILGAHAGLNPEWQASLAEWRRILEEEEAAHTGAALAAASSAKAAGRKRQPAAGRA